MKMRGLSLLVTLAIVSSLTVACGPPIERVLQRNPLAGAKFQVREFDTSTAEIVNYDGAASGYGFEVAKEIAAALRQAGIDAQATPRYAPVVAPGVVDGRITLLDGGRRRFFGYPHARIVVTGTVRMPDGQLGEFTGDRSSVWSGDPSLLRCVSAISYDVATTIATGQFRPVVAAPVPRAEERLEELQRLRDRGLISPEEYERKRAAILNDL